MEQLIMRQLKDAVHTSMSDYKEQDWMVNVPLYEAGMYLSRHFSE